SQARGDSSPDPAADVRARDARTDLRAGFSARHRSAGRGAGGGPEPTPLFHGSVRRHAPQEAVMKNLDGLVDVDRGIISREIFVNEDIYRQEQEQIFARAWLFIGHESQIPRPGDYLVSSMGEESVILCRDRTGRIRVFLNSCRHRGMKVCRYDEGNTVEF